MQTRSQTKKPRYEVNIDFDEASSAWRANKKSIGNGSYKYTCSLCKRMPTKGNDYCAHHLPKK